jgi:hypothetical protein
MFYFIAQTRAHNAAANSRERAVMASSSNVSKRRFCINMCPALIVVVMAEAS